MTRIFIFRKGDNRPKPDRASLDRVARRVANPHKVKKPRPAVTALFTPAKVGVKSEFYRLPIVPSAVVNNPAALVLDGPAGPDAPAGSTWLDVAGWEVPVEAVHSPETIRLFYKKHLRELVDPEDVSVVAIR